MTDEQVLVDTLKVGDAWGEAIREERQAELRELADRQREWVAQPKETRGESAFKEVPLTGGDVSWLAEYSGRGESQDGVKAGPVPNLHLEGADLSGVHLERADLGAAHLEGAFLNGAHLEGADLSLAHLEGADLSAVWLKEADLSGAHLEGAYLTLAHLEGTSFTEAHLEEANLYQARLEGADLGGGHLERADLGEAHLEDADLSATHLEGANLSWSRLTGANLSAALLERADLSAATFDKTSHLNGAVLTGASLDQLTFDNVNLTVVDWIVVPILGDEMTAREPNDGNGKPKDAATRRHEYMAAVRANRVLAVTLRSQGMNEDADRYAYRAQVLQRQVLRRQGQLGRAFGSWLLDLVAGYGYRPIRSVITYVLVIAVFAAAYFVLGGVHGQPLSWNEALVVSLTAFHGRGFFATAFQPGDPQAALAAIEAVIGLLIEITFIATFTNRFFAR